MFTLQKLNKYVDELQTVGPPKPVKLDFFLIEGGSPKSVHVNLNRGGDLSPLFLIEVRTCAVLYICTHAVAGHLGYQAGY
jgi:hypothetical protein